VADVTPRFLAGKFLRVRDVQRVFVLHRMSAKWFILHCSIWVVT
jgi:hypothetical protein